MPSEATQSAQAASAKRVHVMFAPSTYDALRRIAERKGVSISEALRQAIQLTDYVTRQLEEGSELALNRDGETLRLIIP
jgi:hypothetical protein